MRPLHAPSLCKPVHHTAAAQLPVLCKPARSHPLHCCPCSPLLLISPPDAANAADPIRCCAMRPGLRPCSHSHHLPIRSCPFLYRADHSNAADPVQRARLASGPACSCPLPPVRSHVCRPFLFLSPQVRPLRARSTAIQTPPTRCCLSSSILRRPPRLHTCRFLCGHRYPPYANRYPSCHSPPIQRRPSKTSPHLCGRSARCPVATFDFQSFAAAPPPNHTAVQAV